MRISDWSSDVCSSDLPRVVVLEWGDETHPRVAIVGKGVCFDSGGLDIKPSSAMLLMKKDMGGAAHALALARLVMASALPVRLHLVIPIVENAVGSAAFRPGDRSEEHTSELQSLMRISYAVFCLKKKKQYVSQFTYTTD